MMKPSCTGPTIVQDPMLVTGNQEFVSCIEGKVREVNQRVAELHALIEANGSTLEQEGLRRQLETLEGWLNIQTESMVMLTRIFEMGPVWLDDLHKRLNLATEELSRLSDDGGSAKAPKPTREMKELTEVWNGVNNVLESMCQLYARPETISCEPPPTKQ